MRLRLIDRDDVSELHRNVLTIHSSYLHHHASRRLDSETLVLVALDYRHTFTTPAARK